MWQWWRNGWTILILGVCLGLSGCWLSTETEYPTRYFSWQADGPRDFPYQVGLVSNESGAGSRLLFRTASGEVLVDEYNRWLAPPDQMLANALRSRSSGGEQGCNIRIYRCVVDLAAHQVKLGLEWQFAPAGRIGAAPWFNQEFSVPLASNDPEAVTAAFGRAVDAAVAAIIQSGVKK